MVPVISNRIFHKYLVPLISIIVYLILSTFSINNPGLYYDEVLFAETIINPNSAVYSLYFNGEKIPVMIMPYLGALKSWLYLPIYKTIGASPFSIRITSVLIGLFAILLMYNTVHHLFGTKMATVFLLIISTSPAYIFHIRLDWGPVALMMLFKSLSIYYFVKYLKTQKIINILIFGLSIGLGIFDKLTFLWFVIGFFVSVLFLKPRFNNYIIKHSIFLVISISIGALPFIIYLLKTGSLDIFNEPTIKYTELISSLIYKLILFFWTFSGNAVLQIINDHDILKSCIIHQPNIEMCKFKPNVFGAPFSLIPFVFILSVFNKSLRKNIYIKFVFVLSVLVFVQIVISYRARGSHHLMVLSPFPEFVAVHYIINVIKRVSIRKYVVSLLILSNIATDFKYILNIGMVGGIGLWSSAIYDLSSYIQNEKNAFYIFMDWGFRAPISILTNPSPESSELFWQFISTGDNEEEINKLHELTIDPRAVFVLHQQEYTVFETPRQLFLNMLQRYQLDTNTVVFNQKSGNPVYQVIKINRDNSKNANISEIKFRMNSLINNNIEFIGYNLTGLSACIAQKPPRFLAKPGSVVVLYLYFRPIDKIDKRYKIFVHIIGSNINPKTKNQIWNQIDQEPHNWLYPTTEWIPGQIIRDRYELLIPKYIFKGKYYISIGMYDPNTMKRLRVTGDGANLDNNSLIIAEVIVD